MRKSAGRKLIQSGGIAVVKEVSVAGMHVYVQRNLDGRKSFAEIFDVSGRNRGTVRVSMEEPSDEDMTDATRLVVRLLSKASISPLSRSSVPFAEQ